MKTFATAPRAEARLSRPCALCGGRRFEALWDCGGFGFVRCISCGLIQQNPQPLPEAVLARYDAAYRDYEIERQFDYAALEGKTLEDLGIEDLEADLKRRSASRPRVVDAGCATGALLDRLRSRGWDCCGVEPCTEAAAYGRAHFGLDIRPLTLEKASLPAGSFDLVHASQLIEHLNEPGLFLDEARRILAPGGSLILATPNADGFQAHHFGAAWRSAINDHLYLFSLNTLKALLRAHGFEPLRWITWGGWAAGQRPRFLKKPLDWAAKRYGQGDVMAILAVPRT